MLAVRSKIPLDTRMRQVITTIEKAAAKVVADKAEHLVRMSVSLRLLASASTPIRRMSIGCPARN